MLVQASGTQRATDTSSRVALSISGDAERGEKRTSGRRAARGRMDAQCGATDLLLEHTGGDRSALDRLFPIVYDQLRRIAHRELRRTAPNNTLTTTEIVHEAYLRLVDHNRIAQGERAVFLAVAAVSMRRLVVEFARRRRALKRGAGTRPLSLDEDIIAADERSDILLALDEALTRLSALNERIARVVECRYFGGLTEPETAEALGVTARTVRRDWIKAKAWLYAELNDQEA